MQRGQVSLMQRVVDNVTMEGGRRRAYELSSGSQRTSKEQSLPVKCVGRAMVDAAIPLHQRKEGTLC